jgi:hypothetical protein
MVWQREIRNGCFAIGCDLCILKALPLSDKPVILFRRFNLTRPKKAGSEILQPPASTPIQHHAIVQVGLQSSLHRALVWPRGPRSICMWSICTLLHKLTVRNVFPLFQDAKQELHAPGQATGLRNGLRPPQVPSAFHSRRPPSASTNLLRPLARLVLLYLIFIHPLSHQHFKVPQH